MAEAESKRKVNEITSKQESSYRKNHRTSLNIEHILRKRRPFGLCRKGSKDIFVSNKTHFMAQLHKCERLFDKGASEVIIHGLGAAISKASSLALRLKEIHHECVDLDVKTSTVTLIDDLEPLNDDAEYEVNTRQNSAIHIRVFRKMPMPLLKCQD